MQLLRLGPCYGYFAEPSKSIIVVKEEQFREAQDVFADLQVEVVLVGRFLGSCIGNDEGIRQYVQGKVDLWVGGAEQLAEVARAYPQSAYCAFTHSLSCEWSYLQRVIEGYDEEYFHLCDAIQHVFTPAVLGRQVLEREHELFTLPVKLGGLALTDPMKSASFAFSISKEATSVLQEAIQTGEEVSTPQNAGPL